MERLCSDFDMSESESVRSRVDLILFFDITDIDEDVCLLKKKSGECIYTVNVRD